MCGNGVRCFARFIAELENLQGRHRYGLVTVLSCVAICAYFLAGLQSSISIVLSARTRLKLTLRINISEMKVALYSWSWA